MPYILTVHFSELTFLMSMEAEGMDLGHIQVHMEDMAGQWSLQRTPGTMTGK